MSVHGGRTFNVLREPKLALKGIVLHGRCAESQSRASLRCPPIISAPMGRETLAATENKGAGCRWTPTFSCQGGEGAVLMAMC